jgi:hypothetical protein
MNMWAAEAVIHCGNAIFCRYKSLRQDFVLPQYQIIGVIAFLELYGRKFRLIVYPLPQLSEFDQCPPFLSCCMQTEGVFIVMYSN